MDLDLLMRYAPLVECLQRQKAASILEVGSGSYGITRFYRRRVVALDTSFPPPVSPYLEPRIGTATSLPFPGLSFDFVISVDVLEHLPPGERERALREMWRVARKCVICGVPCGRQAMAHEERYNTAYQHKFGHENKWLVEHKKHGLPEKSDVERIVGRVASPGKVSVIPNVNLDFWYATRICELTVPFSQEYQKLLQTARENPCRFTMENSKGDCYRYIFLLSR
ncbi:MAG: class I SAM-dependent methyltransferase [Bacillota bacterium]